MKDIKVGDRVRVTRSDPPYFAEGDEGEVLDLDYVHLAQVRFDGTTGTVFEDGVWWVQIRDLQLVASPYTVILMRPDYIANEYGRDTYMTTVSALTPEDALKLARTQVIEADYESEGDRAEFFEEHEPEDYACIALIRGEHTDLNPER